MTRRIAKRIRIRRSLERFPGILYTIVNSSIRSLIPLVIGLVVGGAGVAMFTESLPGEKGSPEERANRLDVELRDARNRITVLEASGPEGSNRFGQDGRRALADGARTIGQSIREGRPVNPNDIFRASKPLMRDLAPLFDRVRVKEQRRWVDSMTGELARKYGLTPANQTALKVWFDTKSAEEAKKWSEMIGRDDTGLEDVIKASRGQRPDAGLDAFMETLLSGEKLAAFKSERLAERAARVQQEADMKVQRLDAIVKLDDTQRDQIFGVMARSSRDYDPAMVLEGTRGQINATPAADKQAAVLAVLTPDQRAAYDAERQRRREEAEKDMSAIGLTLPPNWEMLDEGDFK